MKYLTSGLALLLLTTPAFAQSIGEKTGVIPPWASLLQRRIS
jgi:hypothetical protein